jgi:hypothetical protein
MVAPLVAAINEAYKGEPNRKKDKSYAERKNGNEG